MRKIRRRSRLFRSECGECGLPANRRKVKTHLDGVDDPGNIEVGWVISQQLNFNAASDKIWYCKVALHVFYDDLRRSSTISNLISNAIKVKIRFTVAF